jgi:hypothetical protein
LSVESTNGNKKSGGLETKKIRSKYGESGHRDDCCHAMKPSLSLCLTLLAVTSLLSNGCSGSRWSYTFDRVDLTLSNTTAANSGTRRTRPSDDLVWQNPNKPIKDPDEGSGRTFEQDKPRLDRFAKEMKENTSADAYIIAYGGLVSYKNEARMRLTCIRKYLTTTHGISRSRLKLIDGGHRVEKAVQLFLVKPGDPIPTAFPIVNREAVRITKATKMKCG